ncbi:macrophage receptor MARCO [Xenopus laevis]|uniref:Macrophage receptor MARCO n=2 Tax=Xenopus laevis TaxID=8355 RepID=A0A1L8EV70_XENLA|nr:macrophage receptor MARCO [Xenopus laevis]OCT63220.1 hypothetical protein XELAEV_18044318mg [Xenopus laevis]
MDLMDDSETQLEEECSSKPFTFSPMLYSGMAPFDINDSKPKRHAVRNGFQIFVFVYLMLLTAVASYLMYSSFIWHQELMALKEEMCSLPCLGKDVTVKGSHKEVFLSQSEENKLDPKIKELLRTLNASILSIEDKRVQRLSELEEEIGIIQVRTQDLFQKLDNSTLIPGPAGKDGPPGARGIPGPPGVKGEPGNRGEAGNRGSPGIKGEKGNPGLQGLKGDEGKLGPTGPMGPSGSDGNGTKGEPGATGPPGAKGDAGERGQDGIPGRPGASGTAGEKGETGRTGLPGTPGTNGDKGEKGNQGLNGDPGQKGEIGASGLNGLPGAKGEPGVPGLPGPKGNPGEKGNPGIQGPPGTQTEIVRLVGGTNRGRVEIFHGGDWGTICDDSWDMNDGAVICRMLGYSRAVQAFTAGGGIGKILLDDVSCVGTETSILECPKPNWEMHNCGHNEDAGVECGS